MGPVNLLVGALGLLIIAGAVIAVVCSAGVAVALRSKKE